MALRYSTFLFCAVLHEMPDHAAVLKTCGSAGIQRIVVCDYDPELRGWLRVWMDLFEPDARWWDLQPRSLLPESEWSLQSGRISRALLWWEFRRIQKRDANNERGPLRFTRRGRRLNRGSRSTLAKIKEEKI